MATNDDERERCIPVVAAVIRRDGRHLVCRRPAHKRHGGLWEFPGGKLVGGESLAEAAARELREELAVELTGTGALLLRVRDPGSPFEIHFLSVRIRGVPRAMEHDEIAWCDRAGLAALPLAPADRRFVLERLGDTDRPADDDGTNAGHGG